MCLKHEPCDERLDNGVTEGLHNYYWERSLYGEGVDILLFDLFIGQASAKVAYNWPLPAGEDAAGPTYPLPTAG